jgi:hypothetical protein
MPRTGNMTSELRRAAVFIGLMFTGVGALG